MNMTIVTDINHLFRRAFAPTVADHSVVTRRGDSWSPSQVCQIGPIPVFTDPAVEFVDGTGIIKVQDLFGVPLFPAIPGNETIPLNRRSIRRTHTTSACSCSEIGIMPNA